MSEPEVSPAAPSLAADAQACLPLPAPEAIDRWEQAKRRLSVLLREPSPDAAWVDRLRAEAAGQRALAARDPDAALYLLVQMAAGEPERYSAHHALLCAVVVELCSQWFEWPDGEAESLRLAALSMNLAMSVMQDALAKQPGPLSQEQRRAVEEHPRASEALLAAAGVADPLWLGIVRHHHDPVKHAELETSLSAHRRLAALLHRVDVYTAQLSRRANREGRSPSIAARDACLDAGGLPDAIGATLLRVLGLYPPGSYVLLANGELGVVVQRGDKAHTPVVAALRRADGGLHMQPMRRDCALRSQAIVRGASAGELKVRLHHERVLALA